MNVRQVVASVVLSMPLNDQLVVEGVVLSMQMDDRQVAWIPVEKTGNSHTVVGPSCVVDKL